MNKRLIAFALVLLIAVGGVFAAYSVPIPGDVHAYLKANVGEFLEHGFKLSETSLYNGSITIDDAFDTDPVFTYGYKTNAQGDFEFRMTVGDFINSSGSGTVKIASVKKGGTVIPPVSGQNYYLLFSESNEIALGATTHVGTADITIVPAKTTAVTVDHLGNTVGGSVVEGAASGTYVATVTISISAS